jgi:hypothetical protein
MNVQRSLAIIVAVSAVAMIGSLRWQRQPAPNWRDQFRQAALQIPFDGSRTPELDSALSATAVSRRFNITIAVPRTADTGRTARIDARITSDSAYPRLGIAAGVNYVWKDFANGKMRLLMIPADTSWKAHWLDVQPHLHVPTAWVPRLVFRRDSGSVRTKVLMCYCTSECRPMTWCNSCDTTGLRALAVTDAPVDEMRRYFARNKVAWLSRQ